MMLTKVTFDKATDAELCVAASIIKHAKVTKIVEGKFPINAKKRKTLVEALTECGYTGIQIDADNRVTDPDALIPFEVALAV